MNAACLVPVILLSALGAAGAARSQPTRMVQPWAVIALNDGRLLVRDAASDRQLTCRQDGKDLRPAGPQVPALLGAFDMTSGPDGRVYTLHWGDARDPRPGVLVQNRSLEVERDIRMPLGSGPGELMRPMGIAVGKDGRIFVADTGNDRVQSFDTEGRNAVIIGIGELRQPMKVALNSLGRLFVADSGRNRLAVYARDSMGTYRLHESLMENMKEPVYVVADAADRVWVSTNRNSGVYVFSPEGALITVWRGDGRRRVTTPRGMAALAHGGVVLVHESDKSLWFARLPDAESRGPSREKRSSILCEPWPIR